MIVRLLVRFANQTDWGYSKMQGELKRLGFGGAGRVLTAVGGQIRVPRPIGVHEDRLT